MSIAVPIKKDTHIVIKKAHLDALLEREKVALADLIEKINAKYGGDRAYVVVNQDEIYYSRVMQVILDGEAKKESDKRSLETG